MQSGPLSNDKFLCNLNQKSQWKLIYCVKINKNLFYVIKFLFHCFFKFNSPSYHRVSEKITGFDILRR